MRTKMRVVMRERMLRKKARRLRGNMLRKKKREGSARTESGKNGAIRTSLPAVYL